MEPRRKLRALEDWKTLAADLLEGYLSDSSVEAYGDFEADASMAGASNPAAAP